MQLRIYVIHEVFARDAWMAYYIGQLYVNATTPQSP